MKAPSALSSSGLILFAMLIQVSNLDAGGILEDAFDGSELDAQSWMQIVSTGISFEQDGPGAEVEQSSGVLVMTQAATDAGGAVLSMPFPVEEGETIIVRKRTRLHFSNANFRALTALVDDQTRSAVAQIQYLNYTYGFTAEYFAINHHTTGVHLPPIWNEWFDEIFTYTPDSGRITYQVNDGPVVEYTRTTYENDGKYRLAMTPYGWFTGHTHEVDWLSVETVSGDMDDDGLPDSWELELIDRIETDDFSSIESIIPNEDIDADGLTNAEEYHHGTDPFNSDSDHDLFSDGYENKMGWNPIQAGELETQHVAEIVRSIKESTRNQEQVALFTESSITELSLGDILIEVISGGTQARIAFPLEVADQLGQWQEVPLDERPFWMDDVSDKPTRFYRVRYRSDVDPSALNQGLVVYLPMDGDLLDVSGNGFHAIQDGDISGAGSVLTIDRFGEGDSAYQFYNTKYAAITVPDLPNSYEDLPELTICLWVQINERYPENRYIAGNFYWGNRHGWGLKLSASGGFIFEAYLDKLDIHENPFTWLGAISDIEPQLGRWYHLVGQYAVSGDSTLLQLFLDGQLVATRSIPGSYAYRSGNRFGMGGDIAREQILAGARVDGVRVYDRLLSPQEIRILASDLP